MSRKSKRRKSPARDITIHRRTEPGSSPGVIVPDPEQPRPEIHVLAYGSNGVVERDVADPDLAHALVGQQPVTWINVEGLGDARTIERFGELFGLHRLALEDTVNVHQRPKVEDYGEITFIVLRMVQCTADRCSTEQISMFIGRGWLLSFQEGRPGDCFYRVRARIREGSGKIRTLGADYLTYALIDAVIDNYYPVLEVYAERLDELEDQVIDASSRRAINDLHEVKADLLILRRAIWPLRDAMAALAREEHPQFSDNTRQLLPAEQC